MGTGQDDRNLGDLTNQMRGWQTGNRDQLHLADAQVTTFLGEIDRTKSKLQAQLNGANGLQSWLAGAHVGQFVSATTTKTHLQEDITEFIEALNSYDRYLDVVKETTNKARNSIRKLDGS
jgi:hypothetical protein